MPNLVFPALITYSRTVYVYHGISYSVQTASKECRGSTQLHYQRNVGLFQPLITGRVTRETENKLPQLLVRSQTQMQIRIQILCRILGLFPALATGHCGEWWARWAGWAGWPWVRTRMLLYCSSSRIKRAASHHYPLLSSRCPDAGQTALNILPYNHHTLASSEDITRPPPCIHTCTCAMHFLP